MRQNVRNVAKSSQSKQSSSQSGSLEHSPSTKTLEKLQSFKFVKISSSKPGSTHPFKRPPTSNSQSDLTPPPSKRRPACNDVTNCEPITCLNDTSGHDSAPINQDRSTFKKPSFIPRTHLNSSTSSFAFSSPSISDSSEVSSPVTINLFSSPVGSHQGQSSNAAISNSTRGMFSNEAAPSTGAHTHTGSLPNGLLSLTRTPTASQHTRGGVATCRPSLSRAVSDSQSRLGTPTLSSVASQSCSGVAPGTPLSTVTSSQSQMRLTCTTPQTSECEHLMQIQTRGRQATPLVCTPTGGVTTPISRASVPIRRKFPGPAGLLPSLVCVCSPGFSP